MAAFLLCRALSAFAALTVASSCSPTEDYEGPTTADQAQHAGVVFTGRALRVNGTDLQFEVRVEVDRYLRGCGPAVVSLAGFRSSAACGVDPPDVGQIVMAFACAAGNSTAELHDIGLHTGALVSPDAATIDAVRAALGLSGAGSAPGDCADAALDGQECTTWEGHESSDSYAMRSARIAVALLARQLLW